MNESKTKPYPGFRQRVGAFARHYVIILIYLGAITLFSLLMGFLFSLNQWLFSDRIRAQLVGFLLIIPAITLYLSSANHPSDRALGANIAFLQIRKDRYTLYDALAATYVVKT